MPHYNYLIVGGGMTADAAAHALREADPKGSAALISAETHPPYNRPPLSKGLWKGEAVESIWRKTETLDIQMLLGRSVLNLSLKDKRVMDNQGKFHSFDKLLLATGGSPRRLPFGGEHIIYFRTFDDYQKLRALADQHERFAVIGGGFIGSEIAAALALQKKKVALLFPSHGIGDRVYPRDLSEFLNGYYREKGVEVLAGESAGGLEKRKGEWVVNTQGKKEITADAVVAGIGIQPNVELAAAAGLKVENGIVVDEMLRTSHPDIYAAGDAAAFHNPALGTRLRVEHEDNANTMGRAAGEAMAGQAAPYHHLPFFYSDLFDLGYEAVGELDAQLETFSDWKVPYREGVVYYLRGGRVRGVLLWNTWGQVDAARKLIAEPGPFKPGDLKGRLPA